MSEHDLVIRNGTLIDGSNSPRRAADVAVRNGKISEVGQIDGKGKREIDADGRLVQPGFVDIHTHYDGQATWDSQLAPSSWHGVTTAVMGNCGVGFAPVRQDDRMRLVQFMEGIEDIPGTALYEGLPWTWESFEEYLDLLESIPHDIDIGTQLPHGALRLYAMGERGVSGELATEDDIATMSEITKRAILAGALGFSSSRTLNHRSSLGEPTPGVHAAFEEMVGIAKGVGATGTGVLQLISDFKDFEKEFHMATEMARQSGRPISISIGQSWVRPNQWRDLLEAMSKANADGLEMRGQVATRAIGVMMGHQATVNPFDECASFKAIADLPFNERVATLRKPEVRAKILEEHAALTKAATDKRQRRRWEFIFELGNPPNYEPDASSSVGARAKKQSVAPAELAYDFLLQEDGRAMLYMPIINYVDGNLDAVREQLVHEAAIPGLSDGGAHVGTVCDVSFPTTLMQWWGRDRPYDRIPLETIVHKQARATAEAVGLLDRGIIAPGYKADINVVDFDALTLHAPTIVNDLPAGGKRFLQKVTGIDHTFVSGVEVASNSESTGETPGKLIRGAQNLV